MEAQVETEIWRKKTLHKNVNPSTVKPDTFSDIITRLPQGSDQLWLQEILLTLAEVLRLQDLPAVQVQVASLGTLYPDLR